MGVVSRSSWRDPGLALLAPGLTGVAFALNVLQASGQADWALSLLAIVVTGSIGSELLSLFVRLRGHRT
jgi:predicted exporter